MLDVSGLSAGYGPIEVVRDVTLRCGAGDVVSIIGPNGAGKSTLCRAISGLLAPRSGRVVVDGSDVTGLSPRHLLDHGLVHVPEGRQLWPQMTVRENLILGQFRFRKSRSGDDLDRVHELFPVLAERANQPAGRLSGGEQQMVAIGRGLMSRPRVLVLDEPSHGLAPLMVGRVGEVISEIAAAGVAVLLVEQNLSLVRAANGPVTILDAGSVASSGSFHELDASGAIERSYFGSTERGQV